MNRLLTVNRKKFIRMRIGLALISVVLMCPSIQARVIDLDTLVKSLTPIESLAGKFTQTYYDSVQDQQTESVGEFTFLTPRYMSWIFQEPEPYSIIIGNTKIWLYDPILETVAIRNTEETSDINSLFFLINPSLLSRQFSPIVPKISVLDTTDNEDYIFLAPTQENNAFSELHISLDRRSHLFKQVVIITNSLSYRKLTFSDIKINPELTISNFEFKIPEGVEIIDQSL